MALACVGLVSTQFIDLELKENVKQKREFDKKLQQAVSTDDKAFDHTVADIKGFFTKTSLIFGSQKQEISMIIDASTPNIYIATTDCDRCNYQRFDVMKSTTSHFVDPKKDSIAEEDLDIYFPKHKLQVFQGKYIEDKICIDTNDAHCLPTGQFFGCSVDPGFDEESGLLGIQLNKNKNGYVERLASQKVIDKAMLGMYIQDNYKAELKSQIRLGGYDSSLMADGKEESINWYKTTSDSMWSLKLIDAKYGDDSFRVSTDTIVEFNPGSPVIAMPQKDYEKLAQLYIAGLGKDEFDCKTNDFCIIKHRCSELSRQKMRFKIGSDANDARSLFFDVPAENFLYDVNSPGFKEPFCLLGVSGTVEEGSNKYILGATFLKNYYTVYDYDNQRIGLSLDISNKELQMKEEDDAKKWTVAAIGFIVFACLLIIGLLLLCLCVKAKKQNQLSDTSDKIENVQFEVEKIDDDKEKLLTPPQQQIYGNIDFNHASLNRDSVDGRPSELGQSQF
ncbi:eukaryotic aspartyl protease family protein [Stylonychia lemnae]|uniref:Eukaryotic aspartyl protease family protein n=1 Tax=Stylonychia lemnae TaxID=5949 RepID=A0A078B0H6_STYLE|nr:eukaryotic aspartyl protease family protein [Stylonychia lemnae]|eukprot:CDW88029.1 eukaryotic aspartyl protease family protein [Stylonychia lemnae]